MNKSFIVLALAISSTYALIPLEAYKIACGTNTNCYTVFNDQDFISKGLKYESIEQYTHAHPYSDPSTNIGFAQSHAQASTFRLWMDLELEQDKPLPIFSELSIVNAAIKQEYTPCGLPSSRNANYLPFNIFSDEEIVFYLKPAFPDDTGSENWCNAEFLDNVNTTESVGYMFQGYDRKFMASKMGYQSIASMLKNKGIGMVTIPHDYLMANGFGFYADGNFRLNGDPLFDYPANVVGVKQNDNGQVMLLVYAFGAHHPQTDYLWVRVQDISSSDSITFIKSFESR